MRAYFSEREGDAAESRALPRGEEGVCAALAAPSGEGDKDRDGTNLQHLEFTVLWIAGPVASFGILLFHRASDSQRMELMRFWKRVVRGGRRKRDA